MGAGKISNAYSADLARVWDRVVPQGGELLGERMLHYFEAVRPGGHGGKVLDLCCGSGRAARFLAEHGYQVLGLDLSPAMIAQAEKHCRGLIGAGKVRFQVADVRDFDEGTGFDLAVSPWDGLNHLENLEQIRACFRCVWRSLAPGGMFIFDLVGREGLIHDTVTIERHHDWVAMLEERYSPESGTSQTRFSGFMKKKGGDYERYDQTLSWTLFAMADITRALRETGFREIHLLDEESLEHELTQPEEAPRVFFVATRPT
ncbi:MAG: class I SAM-dependent DNA methyltransferase [Thermoplasmata archaeon]